MRLFLDECFAPKVVADLRQYGLDVVGIRERGLKGATDDQIWAEAQRLERTTVTANYGDYRGLARSQARHQGLIVLRLSKESTEINVARIREAAAELERSDLRGRIVTVRDRDLSVDPPFAPRARQGA